MQRAISFSLSLTSALVVSLTFNVGSATAQTQPCGGQITFSSGGIKLGTTLAPTVPLSDATRTCLKAIGQLVKERRYIRSLTVVVRLPDEQRKDNKAIEIAKAMSAVLIEGGAPKRRVSQVAPAIGHGQRAGVQLAYTEMRPGRPVAKLITLSGTARYGREISNVKSAAMGTMLRTHDLLLIAQGSRGIVQVADGSQLQLGPSAQVRFGRVALNSKYKREVEIQVIKGSAQTVVAHGDGAPFKLVTRAAVAGVRGTTFRTHVADDGSTRIELLEGQVDLGNDQGSVAVNAGYGSRANPGQAPEPPRKLLQPAVGHRPLRGTFSTAPELSWMPVADATRYLVEFALNAEFTKSVSTMEVTEAKVAAPQSLALAGWFWRVSAIDKDGFIGMPSKIFVFTIDPNPQPAEPASQPGAPNSAP